MGHWDLLMNRKIYHWKLRTTELQLGERTLLMGVLNITPDSFSDGGQFNDPDRAYARALEMEEQGADIIRSQFTGHGSPFSARLQTCCKRRRNCAGAGERC